MGVTATNGRQWVKLGQVLEMITLSPRVCDALSCCCQRLAVYQAGASLQPCRALPCLLQHHKAGHDNQSLASACADPAGLMLTSLRPSVKREEGRTVSVRDSGSGDSGGILGYLSSNDGGEVPNISLHLPSNSPTIPQALGPSLKLDYPRQPGSQTGWLR